MKDALKSQAAISRCSMRLLFLIIAVANFLSCTIKRNGEPVDFGPQATTPQLNKALLDAIGNADPSQIKVGQFVHFSTTELLNGNQIVQVMSDTGQTVVSREETVDAVKLDVIQNKIVYGKNQQQKSSLEYQMSLSKSIAAATATVAATEMAIAELRKVQQNLIVANPAYLATFDVPSPAPVPTPTPNAPPDAPSDTPAPASAPTGSNVSIHRLIVSDSIEVPPGDTASQPDCLGIPNCKIHVHHVSFDQVIVSGGTPDRVHFELAVSPDVPMLAGYRMTPLFEYFPGLIKACVTLQVPIGTSGSKVLVTECNILENFRFVATPP